MIKQEKKQNPLIKIASSTFMNLPSPRTLKLTWNIGSLLSLCLIIQIITGLLLASTYAPDLRNRFSLIKLFSETLDKAWLIRYIHSNGASLFFICIYIHIARGIYYNSFLYIHTWMIGVTILLLTMAAAFIGYVLPINQISFWGASVITNLFSEVPYIGQDLVQTIWGGPSVDTPTVSRFFTFHFILPFIILVIVILHIIYLHETGSNNPLGLKNNITKIKFNPFFIIKDLMGVFVLLLIFILICLYHPLSLGDDENFFTADPSVTPHHIQPEWYFLFAYAILRSIPNKLGGVIALLLSVLILYTLPFSYTGKSKRTSFYTPIKNSFWFFSIVIILLTWIGARPVEPPYIFTGQILTFLYFFYFLTNPFIILIWDKFHKI